MNNLQEADHDIGGLHSQHTSASIAPIRSKLPQTGRRWSDIRADLMSRKRNDYDWRAGRMAIYVYHDDDELLSVSREAYNLYFTENALGRRAFPSLARMEEEVIRMCQSLFHAPEEADGSFTSGGTESIFLALKTARDRYRSMSAGSATPTVIVPATAHPAFDKAAHYLGVEIIRIGTGAEWRVDVGAVEKAIDNRTMLIAGSAPCYPYGVFDDIVALGQLAASRRVWLHVDACLGGFLAPFAREEGFAIPAFDFSVPGVWSLSADLHKYGFSARGASVLLYRSASLKAFQGFQFDAWPRGAYATETFLGSRPGGSIASAWAVAQFLGHAGYRRLARKTLDTKERLIQHIRQIAGLEVLQPSELSILLYRSIDNRVDIDRVADLMGQKGWFVGRSREPRAVHLALNSVHAPIVDEYALDLEDAVRHARASGAVGLRDDKTY